ncbi:hypothetical protein SARC_11758 [Sphaeroforma arctica JP610]|uniref:Alpha 1,4-glycosyltransferase domain-containing protein n=1 Tax=Sphaeroforma arctica JP610 TaxID=667725 RepID=A0A0L0FGY2_9EUKA|nr:hypothetical protein SARC_11758 [Sphaeroforma arctica JP610]KNC75721.1 hypothetical protein SARC_11758 [Sphaeroforma arctica JP610]|eukprot:XP_014149623.1 hypothetical protein SARC_11758 [Sphaeroforma arctica JP610]
MCPLIGIINSSLPCLVLSNGATDCFLVHYLPGLKTVGDAHHFPNNVRFCAGNGVLLNWERHHPLMQKALDHFDNHYDPQCWGCAGPRLMGQLIPEYLSRVTLVAEKLVFPVQYREASTYLSREDDAFCEHIMQNAVGFHMYGQATSQQDVKKGSVTACIIAKVRLRPDDNVPFDKVRTPAGAVLKRAYDPSVMHSAKTCKNLQLVPLERNVAVVLLAYKRVDLVGRILEMFVESRYIREVVIWNNNPDRLLDADKLAKVYEKLPRNKYTGEVPYVPCVRVYNSRRDGNVLFLGRFAACLASSSPLCYFQDDDWIVRDTEQLLHLANREPHRVHSITNGEVVRTANSWKFGNPKIHMNAQFSWVGTGACVSRKMVQNFFLQLLASRLSVTDRTMADFFFTAWTNAPQDVIEGEIVELTRANAFSGAEGTKDWGKGTQRNIDYIMYSLSKLYEILTRPAYAEVRHLFLPYTPDVAEWYRTSGGGGSGGAANARHAPPQQYPNAKRTKLLTMPVYTNTTLLESETSLMQDPTLYPGCTVSNDRYRAILRTDASEFGLGHRPMYNPTFTLDMHVTQNSVPNYKFERNLRNMVDGSLSTNFEPIFRRKCHNITMEFLRPYPCTYVSVTLDAGPESVEMYVGLASESDVQSIGKYMLGRWDGTQTIYGGRAGVDTKNKIVSKGLAKGKNTRTDKQNVRQNNHNSRRGSEDRLGEVSWVVLEVCARISGAYFQDVKIYDIDLVAEV